MKKSFEATGKTIDEAVEALLVKANISIADIDSDDIEILSGGSGGFFGLGRKDAKVRITIETPDQPEAKPAAKPSYEKPAKPMQEKPAAKPAPIKEQQPKAKPQPQQQAAAKPEQPRKPQASKAAPGGQAKPEHKPEHKEGGRPHRSEPRNRGYQIQTEAEANEMAVIAINFLKPIFQSLDVQPEYQHFVKEGILWITFSGQALGSLIGRRGETLNSLQYLTNLAVNKDKKDHIRLVLDVEDYRAGREETLAALAKRMADKAVRTGKWVELEPMNPHERRIVHIALQNDKRVDTTSQGDEPYRRIVINRKRHDKKKHHNNRPKNNQATASNSQVSPQPANDQLSLSQQLDRQFEEQIKNRS